MIIKVNDYSQQGTLWGGGAGWKSTKKNKYLLSQVVETIKMLKQQFLL